VQGPRTKPEKSLQPPEGALQTEVSIAPVQVRKGQPYKHIREPGEDEHTTALQRRGEVRLCGQ
jgi:hypothetical protein